MGKPPYFGPRAYPPSGPKSQSSNGLALGPAWPCVRPGRACPVMARVAQARDQGRLRCLLQQTCTHVSPRRPCEAFFSFVNGRVTDVVPVGRALTRGASDAAEGRVESVVRATSQEALQPRTDRASPTGRAAYTWCGQCGQARSEPIGRAPTRGAGVAVAGRRRTGSLVAPLSCGAADGAERCSCLGHFARARRA